MRALIVAVLLGAALVHAQEVYHVGTGIADITGPAAQINMMGYANPSQTTKGIHLRIFSRAFIFEDQSTGNRLVFVNADIAFTTENINKAVVERLQQTYGDLYTFNNVAITATHTHAGVAGYAGYVMFQVTSMGFCEENFWAIVDGIYESIVQAHNSVRPAYLYINAGELLDANINRSPSSYENNPAEERARYSHNTDTQMTLLKIVGVDGEEMGMLSWFAVHPTSMNNTNRLISGDNKGYAEYLMEADFNGMETRPGQGRFIAAFCSSNLGDVSPNIKGAFCTGGPNIGQPCDYYTSTCPNDRGMPRTQLCHAQGPAGSNDKENCRIIGERQYVKARELWDSAKEPVHGTVDWRHQFIEFSSLEVDLGNGETKKLCKPAMGYSFAAGTTDGPGFFTFHQGDQSGNEFWNRIRDLLKEPSQELMDCQAPKPVLLATGEVTRWHKWQPDVVPLQIVKIGNLVILVVPGEFTTMAGRRLRETVRAVLEEGGITDAHIVITGLSNTYSDYVTTYEEYQMQRYEAASTIYGPHTLQGYQQEFTRLARALVNNQTVPEGPSPPDYLDEMISLIPEPKEDTVPAGVAFGDLVTDVASEYRAGDLASATFWAGNPRNELRRGGSFFDVEQFDSRTGNWTVHRSDADWETEFRWEPVPDTETFQSQVTLNWFITELSPVGSYRLHYHGHWRDAQANIHEIDAVSSTFRIVGAAR